jgi:ATP:corrinoid adenosyltransferase
MFQFLKKNGNSSENWLEFPNFRIVCLNQDHPMFSTLKVKGGGLSLPLAKRIKNDLVKIKGVMRTGKYDVIILDEILNCVSEKFLGESKVLELIKAKPARVELVLTGRGATPRIVAVSDYATRLDKIKHPFDKGERARKGIEY